MGFPLRSLASALVAVHLVVVAAPCVAASRVDGSRAHESNHHEMQQTEDAADPAPHCSGAMERPPVDVSASCPCGCDDAAAPGGPGGRLGYAVLGSAPEPPTPGPSRTHTDPLARLPAAAPSELDPIPI
jgi:hypothetical protein